MITYRAVSALAHPNAITDCIRNLYNERKEEEQLNALGQVQTGEEIITPIFWIRKLFCVSVHIAKIDATVKFWLFLGWWATENAAENVELPFFTA